MRGALALASFAALAALGCSDGGSAAAPGIHPGTLPDAGPMPEAGPDATYAVCPPGLDASFQDLRTLVFNTPSCGSDSVNGCHSTPGSKVAKNLLDFTLDASAVYAELLGNDGGGEPARNINGDAAILRVAPGAADASMLYIKLTITGYSSAHWGSGMPLTEPGSICPEALDAVRSWIEQGAKP